MAALNVQSSGGEVEDQVTSAINTTPLVDIMLVLLIIFLVTIPVIVKTVPLELPNARNIATVTKPENIVVSVDRDENVYWNNAPVQYSELRGKFEAAMRRAAAGGSVAMLPEVHIRSDKNARFESVGRVILACQEAGVLKVAFLTEPRNESE